MPLVIVGEMGREISDLLSPALTASETVVASFITQDEIFEVLQDDVAPDLLIVHVNLPGDIPVEYMCRLIRDVPACVSMPILLLSPTAAGMEERVIEAGATGFLTCPTSARELMAWIRVHTKISLPPSNDDQEPAPPPPPPPQPPQPPRVRPSAPPPPPSSLVPPPPSGRAIAPPTPAIRPTADRATKPPPPLIVVGLGSKAKQLILHIRSRWNDAVRSAHNVSDLQSILRSSSPAAILFEWELDGTTGDAACRYIRMMPEHQHVPMYLLLPDELAAPDQVVTNARGTGYFLHSTPPDAIIDHLIAEGTLRMELYKPTEKQPSKPAPPLPPPPPPHAPPPREQTTAAAEFESRSDACRAIGRMGMKEGIPFLLSLIEEGDHEVLVDACWSLGELRAREAEPVLRPLLNDEQDDIRCTAAEALGKIAAPGTVALLLKHIPTASERLVLAIVSALGAMGTGESLQALRMLSQYDDPAIAAAARLVLEDDDGGED